MKYCTYCGKEVNAEAVVCTNCGCMPDGQENLKGKYCIYCGEELLDGAVVCIKCGCPVSNKKTVFTTPDTERDLLTELSNRMKINGIIWLIIGICQIVFGFIGMFLFDSWFVMIIGVLNIVNAIQDMNFSKQVLEKPLEIVKKFDSIVGPIIVLIYNLVIGGIIGVIGSIYYFVAIRSFVMENKEAFTAIENRAKTQSF